MWSEAIEVTNGIGSGIAEERPITIHRNQHFRSRHTDLSCSGAPVFGVDGRLMAVLDVSAIALRPVFQKPLKEECQEWVRGERTSLIEWRVGVGSSEPKTPV